MATNNEPVSIANAAQMESLPQTERLAYSIAEAAELLGVHYFSVYRMIPAWQAARLPCAAWQTARASLGAAQTLEG
jgi:transposase